MTDNEILKLPLFQGLGEAELNFVRDNKLLKRSHGKKSQFVISEEEKCEALVYIISGSVICHTDSDDNSYSIEETLHSPILIEPERLFGISQRYGSTYKATTVCDLIKIEKASVIALMEHSMIFRINVLNILSTMSQRRAQQFWHQQSTDISKRIIRFIKDRCIYPAGHKVINISMVDLARELGCSRLEASEALHILESNEFIRLHRQKIEVPMMELLLKTY